MADPLYGLLTPYFDALDAQSRPSPSDPTTTSYLHRLTTLSLADLSTAEPSSLSQNSHSLLRSLQALSKRSHKSIISSATHLSQFSTSLPPLYEQTSKLQDATPPLESSAAAFAQKYKKSSEVENEVLLRRRKALLLSQNADRISSVLDLPSLLSTAISSSSQTTSTSSSVNYASALDLHAHIKRLTTLYPSSPLITSISSQAAKEMKLLTTNLIASLQTQGIKLAAAMRTIGWLRRVAPELDENMQIQKSSGGMLGSNSSFGSSPSDGSLGALFLVCRLANLISMLEALEPLRELADQETSQRERSSKAQTPAAANGTKADPKKQTEQWAGGQQTERYLKRYIEIFREQSFAIVSMYRSIFPSALPVPGSQVQAEESTYNSSGDSLNTTAKPPPTKDETSTHHPLPLLHPPSPLSTFPSHLIETLFTTLQAYLPNIKERSARDSLMTQVLYCAGSLGRLGGDFSMMLALLEEEEESEEESADDEEGEEEEEKEREWEWVDVMKKHRVQASRLELLASGVGTGTTGRGAVVSPSKE
ncbi:Dor1-domain-containing protein [Tothia fuscella]|uniref:Conserved oligomeric Golgi complex subunit 8 n=1 Tax=Tothia fuscella TaxID=1048955 RepID=A0A9P4TY02_9PEZI|nr:Dor1-domain-containing protein [Tothia fuscella]